MKVNCKHIKRIVGSAENGFVYNAKNSKGEPEVHIDMTGVELEKRISTKIYLGRFGISLYQNPKNDMDYVVGA